MSSSWDHPGLLGEKGGAALPSPPDPAPPQCGGSADGSQRNCLWSHRRGARPLGGGRRVRAWASPHSFHGKLEAGFLGEGWRSWGGGEPGRSGGWPGLARAGRLATAGAEVGSSCRAGLGARSLLSGPSEPWPRCGGSQILLLLLLLLLGLSLTQWMLTVPVAAEATTGTAPLRSPCSPVPGPVGSGSPWSPCPRCSALWRICSQTLFLLQNR